MAKISEITGHAPAVRPSFLYEEDNKLPMPGLHIGLELELEEIPVAAVEGELKYWKIVKDGSLRDASELFVGKEFIFNQPLYGKDISAALDELDNLWDTHGKPKATLNCSTHVHIDVRDLDTDDIIKICMIHLILEDVLFRYEGTGRDYSNFCVPWRDMPISNKSKIKDLDNPGKFLRTAESWSKYSSLNISAIRRQGSIEFRHMHGLVKKEEILRWIKILMSVIRYSLNLVDYKELPRAVSVSGVIPFIKDVFGEELSEFLLYDKIEEDVYNSIRLFQTYHFCTEENESGDLLVNDEEEVSQRYRKFYKPVFRMDRFGVGVEIQELRHVKDEFQDEKEELNPNLMPQEEWPEEIVAIPRPLDLDF